MSKADLLRKRAKLMRSNDMMPAFCDELEQAADELDALAAHLLELKSRFIEASSDITRLFEIQPQNMDDGSYEADGQSVTELGQCFDKSPQVSLAERDYVISSAYAEQGFKNGYYHGAAEYASKTPNVDQLQLKAESAYDRMYGRHQNEI